MPPWIELEYLDGVGTVSHCQVCDARVFTPTQQDAYDFAEAHRAHMSRAAKQGWVGAGDVVAGAVNAVRGMAAKVGVRDPLPEGCTPCERRRRAMNRMVPRMWKAR